MSTPLLGIVIAIYMYTGAEQIWRGNISGGVVWFSYACANTALMWHLK